jgi:hypothetical protein
LAHDAADAEAICEAVERPTMVKTAEQQATALLHRGRKLVPNKLTMLMFSSDARNGMSFTARLEKKHKSSYFTELIAISQNNLLFSYSY